MRNNDDPFVPGTNAQLAGASEGPLRGLTFAAKDLFDVAGHPTGGGNPDWPGPACAPRNAWLVGAFLDAGADLIGKTITDEVSLGILGDSAFFGTPLNPAAPDSVPGGSSSGSASAVASGRCDFAIGTDTGGSVRVPSSFCGLFGIRPTHGRLNLSGMMSQAPSSDTAGWFAKDADVFVKISEVALGEPAPQDRPTRLLVATDAFGFADESVSDALMPAVERLASIVGHREDVVMAPPGLSVWAKTQRTLQSSESWETFKGWLDATNPAMAFSVARALTLGSQITDAERQWAVMMREEARARLRHLLPRGTVLCMPTTPFPAVPKGLSVSEQAPYRDRITCLTGHGGLTGVCQVNVPGALAGGKPVGLSLVGGRGADMDVVALAATLTSEGNV